MKQEHESLPVGDIIRKTVMFSMDGTFTIKDVVEQAKRNYGRDVDEMAVSVYLERISRAGLVDQSGKRYWINF
jgi:phosphatidate phosphatase PAH1